MLKQHAAARHLGTVRCSHGSICVNWMQGLAKGAFDDFCMAANEASLHAMGITGCPNCGAYVERLPPANTLNGLLSHL